MELIIPQLEESRPHGQGQVDEDNGAAEQNVVRVAEPKKALPPDAAEEEIGAAEEIDRHIGDSQKAQCSRRGGGHEEDMHMPEELVEIIISRIPFPSLFKARTLSKSWFFKFPLQSLKSLQSVKALPSVQPSLQSLISSVSPQWTTYCPVYFTTEDILGFDRAAFAWRSIVPLSYLSASFDSSRPDFKFFIATAGPLLLCVIWSETPDFYSYFVTNVITKSYRKLPSPPEPDEDPSHIRLLQVGSDHYKVVLVYPVLGAAHVYSSRIQGWSMSFFDPHRGEFSLNSAHLDDKLYCLFMVRDAVDSMLTLATYLVRYDFWLKVIPTDFFSREIRDSAILVCEGKVMVAVWFQKPRQTADPKRPSGIKSVRNWIGIFRLNFKTQKLKQVGRGPPLSVCKEAFGENKFCYNINFASDANFIYFGGNYNIVGREFPVISYDVRRRLWSCLPPSPPHARLYDAPMLGSAFQPGLNPFMLV